MTDATADLSAASNLKRRAWQFSLRALLVLPVVVAVVIALILLPIQRRRKLDRLIARIESMGGQVGIQNGELKSVDFLPDRTSWQSKFHGMYFGPPPYAEGPAVNDEQLIIVRELGDLESLRLAYTEIGDVGLKHLKGNATLRELDAYLTRVTDDGMAWVGSLRNLEKLNLSKTAVGDAGLGHLKQQSQLRKLSLADTQVTDAGLSHLAGLTKLDSLDLTNTSVTDAGIRHLQFLTEIGELRLGGTYLTDKSLEIIRAFPKLHLLSFWCPQEHPADEVNARHSVSWSAISGLARSRPEVEITYTSNFRCRVDGDNVVFDANGVTITFENAALRSRPNQRASENTGTLTVLEGRYRSLGSGSWANGVGMMTEVSCEYHGSDYTLTIAGQKLFLLPNGSLRIGDQVLEVGPEFTRITVTTDGTAQLQP